MAPRANWKGILRLSLVTCPVALYPATSDSEKISFNQINRNTGHRIKYVKVDADTGEEVASEDIGKGYKIDTDTYVEVSKEELENVALESTRTIDISLSLELLKGLRLVERRSRQPSHKTMPGCLHIKAGGLAHRRCVTRPTNTLSQI
jgi:hypothetical protein